MKLWAIVSTDAFQVYLDHSNLPNCPATLQKYLYEIGTPSISFQAPLTKETDYIEVPQGSCIKLRTEDQYNLHASHLTPKQDKSRRTSSCTIV